MASHNPRHVGSKGRCLDIAVSCQTTIFFTQAKSVPDSDRLVCEADHLWKISDFPIKPFGLMPHRSCAAAPRQGAASGPRFRSPRPFSNALSRHRPSAAAGHSPSVISAQRKTVALLRNAIRPGSIAASLSCGITAVATTMSQRSLTAADIALCPAGCRCA